MQVSFVFLSWLGANKEIVVYRRENGGRPYHYNEGDMVELTSIGVNFSFDAVYQRIRLAYTTG